MHWENQILPLCIACAVMFLGSCNRAKPDSPQLYLALGDSYTSGQSVDPNDRWPVQLASMLREQKIDLGEPRIIAQTGWTTDELSAGIDDENPRATFQLVSLQIGVNNQFRGRSVEEFRTQFSDLLKRSIGFAGGINGHVFVLSIPDWGVMPFARGRDRSAIGRQIDQFNSVCRKECERQQIAFVDITSISRRAAEDSTLIAQDVLHPSAKMYRLWCEAALPTVRDALKDFLQRPATHNM